jgi:hypothetical protein
LLDWLVEVHGFEEEQQCWGMEAEVLSLAVQLVDRYLCIAKVERAKLQALGCAALFIAAYTVAGVEWTPSYADLAEMAADCYTS